MIVINNIWNLQLWLHTYPPEEVLAADYLLYDWKPDLIEKIYAYLSPDNVRVTVLTKKAKFFATHVEPHFGTEYHVEKIPNEILDKWHNCGSNIDLNLPKPNLLIDNNPQMVEIGKQSLCPCFFPRKKDKNWQE